MSQIHQKILTFALRSGLDAPKNLKLISKGTYCETYTLFNQQSRYVVIRILDSLRTVDPYLLIKMSRYFKKMGFPVAKVDETSEIDDSHLILTNFQRGKVKVKWNQYDFEKLGLLIGSLHIAQSQLPRHYSTPSVIDQMRLFVDRLDDALPEVFHSVISEVEDLANIWPSHLPTGLIHGDIWNKNIFFENGEISALLDFHFPFYDAVIYDIGTVMKSIFFSKDTQEAHAHEKFNAFLSSYRSVYPLSNEEIEYLPLMLRAKVIYTILFMLAQASQKREQREKFLSNAMFNLIKLAETKEFSLEKIPL